MTKNLNTHPKLEKLASLIKDIQFGMMTTIDRGYLRSRPMAAQEIDEDGDLWFFTGVDTAKADDIQEDNRVNIAFARPGDQQYVSVSGSADLILDRQKAKELWSPPYNAWFPKGLEDPNLLLLKVSVEQAEYWDAPSGAMVQLIELAKAALTGKPSKSEGSDHMKITVKP